MKYYTTNPYIKATLNPTGKLIYLQIIAMTNEYKKSRCPVTRKALGLRVKRALGTIRNALQGLRKMELIYFDIIDQCWKLVVQNLKAIDNYDNYIKHKWDNKQRAIGENIYLFGYERSRQMLL